VAFSILSSILAGLIPVMLRKLGRFQKNPPGYTLGFNFSLYLTFLLFFILHQLGVDNLPVTGHLPTSDDDLDSQSVIELFDFWDLQTLEALAAGTVRGVGQVFLCGNIWSGVLMIAAKVVCHPKAAAFACGGSFVGTLLGILWWLVIAAGSGEGEVEVDGVSTCAGTMRTGFLAFNGTSREIFACGLVHYVLQGLAGYNAVLASMGVLITFGEMTEARCIGIAIAASLFCTLIQLLWYWWPSGTFPFCIGTLVVYRMTLCWKPRAPEPPPESVEEPTTKEGEQQRVVVDLDAEQGGS